MPTTDRNYIYAYDDEKHEIIVIDARTGERVSQKENRVLSILSYLNEQQEEVKLRRFAIWCARQTNTEIKPMQRKFLELAERAIEADAKESELRELYEKSEGEAVASDTVGLQQGSRRAAGYLATRECINPNALEAAKNAARFHCLFVEMNEAKSDKPEFIKEIGPAATEDTIEEVEQEQVNYLLDLIGE